jgi:hypothetical protein
MLAFSKYMMISKMGGGFMSLISKIFYHWYQLRKNYHQALYDSCLDYKIKSQLKIKIEYHKRKVDQLKSIKAY